MLLSYKSGLKGAANIELAIFRVSVPTTPPVYPPAPQDPSLWYYLNQTVSASKIPTEQVVLQVVSPPTSLLYPSLRNFTIALPPPLKAPPTN